MLLFIVLFLDSVIKIIGNFILIFLIGFVIGESTNRNEKNIYIDEIYICFLFISINHIILIGWWKEVKINRIENNSY